MIAGNEGILSKAETAVSETEISGAKEQAELLLAEISAEFYEKKYVDKTESGALVDYIKTSLALGKATSNGDYTVTVDNSGNVTVTDKNENVIVTGKLDENGKIHWNKTSDEQGGVADVIPEPTEVWYKIVDTTVYLSNANTDGSYTQHDETLERPAWAGTNWQNTNPITKVVIENTIAPTTTKNWFYVCLNLIEIENINNLNTSNVTDMSNMFVSCDSLTSLDLSTWDTRDVTAYSSMLSDVTAPVKIGPNWNPDMTEEAVDYSGFFITGTEGGLDWFTILADATANPEKYKHADTDESTYIGIATNGEPVDMDLWVVTEAIGMDPDFGSAFGYALSNLRDNDGYYSVGPAYLGTDFDNIIMPQYIKAADETSFKPVTDLHSTFKGCGENLTKSPKIPETVKYMYQTFYACSISEPPVLPSGLRLMKETFWLCNELTRMPQIPSTVEDMTIAFGDCTKLTGVTTIPDSVLDLQQTFEGCTSLETAPEIGSGVESMFLAFDGCESLTGIVKVNSKNVTSSSDCFNNINNALTVQVPKDSTTYTTFYEKYGTASNITIETF